MAITGKDLLNRRKQNTAKKTGITGSDLLEARKLGTTAVNDDYISSYIKDTESYIKNAQKEYEGVGWGNAADTYAKQTSTYDDLEKRRKTINSWLKLNQNKVENYDSLAKSLADLEKSTADVYGSFKSAKDYYSQWDTQEAYDAYKKTEDKKKAILEAPDFKEYSDKGAAMGEGYISGLNQLLGKAPKNTVSNMRQDPKVLEAYETAAKTSNGAAWGTTENMALNNINYKAAKYMTDEEFGIYNYYFAKDEQDGTNLAQEYLSKIENVLNYRQGSAEYEGIKDKPFLEMLFGIEAGLDQFASGISNIENYFTGEEGNTTSSTQYASGMIRENLGTFGKGAYDLITTTSNMLPSVLAGAASNLILPGAGTFVGAGLMGASAAGNAYAEMRNLGYNEDQARGYATLVGASEAALSALFSGVKGIGGKLTNHAIKNFVSGIDNGFARVAIKYGSEMLSEGFEESVQSVLEPMFKRWTTGEEFDVDWGEVAYSGLLGALSAGILNAVPTTFEIAQTMAQGKNIKANEGVERLKTLGTSMSADSAAYKIANKIDENTGAYKIGLLLNEVGATLSEQNMSDIRTSLESKGVAPKDAATITKWMQRVVEGKDLTKRQAAAIEANDVLTKTLREEVLNPSSTIAQRVGEFKTLYDLAQTKATPTKAEKSAPTAEEAPEVTENAPEKEKASEGKISASEDNTKKPADTDNISEIIGKVGDKYKVRLNDGTELLEDAAEMSPNTERLFATAKDMGLNAESANAFLKNYDGSMSAADYAQAYKEAYQYGEYNFAESEMRSDGLAALLNESQRRIAYESGRIDRKYKTEAKQAEIKKTDKKQNKGKLHNTFAPTNERQKASLKALGVLAEALGIDIYTFESETNAEGKHIGKNGWYDPKDNSIHIDVYAGEHGHDTILFTAAHELTHMIRRWSPAKFKVFADFLMEKYGEQGKSVSELVRAQISKAEDNGRKITFDEAYEEVVADSCESFLADGDAIAKIAELKAKDKSLWEKIKDYLTKLVARIKAAYEGLEPDSKEGKFVASLLDSAEELRDLWIEAVVDASTAYNEGEIESDTDAQADNDIRYSYRGESQDGIEVYETSEDILRLPWNERKKLYLSYIEKSYVGRTAKFVRNGHVYYAEFDRRNASKAIYGDKRSDPAGRDALINTGADGSVFELVENSTYNGSAKDTKNHSATDYFDYFIKTVQIDNKVFDLLADVKRQYYKDGGFVYTLRLIENKKIKASPIQRGQALLNNSGNTLISEDIVPQKSDSVNPSDKNIYSERDPDTVSNRTLLAEALEGITLNDIEKNKLADYKANAEKLDAAEARLKEVRAEIKDISFSKGTRDKARLSALKEEATQLANRINIYDRRLINLEATSALKGVLDRAKADVKAREKAKAKADLEAYKERSKAREKEIAEAYRESRAANVEGRRKTEMRHKIQRVAKELDSLLNNGTKERNVKNGVADIVRRALDLSDMLFATDDELIVNGFEVELSDNETEAINEYKKLYEEYHSYDDAVTENKARRAELRSQMTEVKHRFDDAIERERKRISKAKAGATFDALIAEYKRLENAKEEYLNLAHKPEVVAYIESLKNTVGADVLISDMTLEQLASVYKAFTMIKEVVTNSNKLWRDGKRESIEERRSAVFKQINKLKDRFSKDYPEIIGKALGGINKAGWNNLRPVDAFELVGSDALSELFWDVIDAQSVYAKDIEEVRNAIVSARQKYGYKKWKMNETTSFEMADGRTFTVTLGELMSIYAYSKREQADAHMREGGFQHAKGAVYKDGKVMKLRGNKSLTYKIDDKMRIDIMKALTKEQADYVDEIQKLLTSWGEKGNEASRILYGIDLFNEEVYFPLKSSSDYLDSVQTQLGQTSTTASLAGSGMAKPTKPHANNPIILQAFDDVVLDHFDRMSKYHAYVVPIDNLRKILDARAIDSADNMLSVKALIGEKFGDGATEYLQNYITDLNGSAAVSGAKNPLESLFSKAKGASVSANLSVWVQQYFSIIRAFAEVNPKYFIPFMDRQSKADMKSYAEMKKYAPIATIKEMGGFDVGSSRGITDYIGYEESGMTLKKASKQMQDAFGIGATFMDKLGWTTIWKGIKKEVAASGKYKVGSEEYLKACGKRFEEVIVKTQVYDSVNARSGFMRSKHGAVKYLVSFMGEPTAIMGMAEVAVIKMDRAVRSKNKEALRKAAAGLTATMSAIAVATAMTSIVKSLVYAMRDDDEDETYLEKYAASLASAFKDDINIFTYLPITRDIVSIWEGRTIERPDMTLIADAIDSFNALMDTVEDEDTTVDEVLSDSFALAGSIANILGIPAKNIWRDLKGLYNTVSNVGNGYKSNVGNAVVEGLTEKETKKGDNLYTAIVSGDTKRVKYYKSTYKNESAYNSAVRKALRENDPRIKEAAEARYNGRDSEYSRIAKQIIREGNFTQDDVVAAINAEVMAMKKSETTT